jgi:hypothetical protein
MTDLPERIAQAVAERVVTLVVGALDLNALLERVDIDALIERVDVSALLDRVDVDELLARIDVDDLMARIDVETLVARIDLASTMASTASSAAEGTLSAVRRTAVRGDDVGARWANRLMGRR